MSPNFMLLKVLELRNLPIAHVPDEVADLFNLRYLSLRRTKVENLPKHIDKLQMLETLDVKGTRVAYIPRRIRKLTRLRHLLMDQPRLHTKDGILIDFVTDHSWVWQLKDLLTLKTVRLDSSIIEDMAELIHLRRLALANLKEKQWSDLCKSLSAMRELLSLSIKAAPADALKLESLSSLPPQLQKLVVDGRMQKLPMWFGFLTSLTHLYLIDSQLGDEESNPLPLLGELDNLLHLTLRRAYDGSRLCFVAQQFRGLKSLNIEELECLRELEVEEDALPSLCALHLCRCRGLARIEGVHKLPSPCLIYLQEMPDELSSQLGGDSRVKRSHGWKSVCNSIAWPV
ncbi:disease resistance protein RPM1-like [Curcuma longa]|uniref:disease resistance protein RPM1-like n=1 Tax=Curcuma longa TaxID=136217 RepID=UPI003D9F5187